MSHDSHDEHAHGARVGAYFAVFIALAFFTLVSFLANLMAQSGTITHAQSFATVLGVAVVKAMLVASIFMHLKWDWGKLYFMILPSFVLAPFLVFALLPDIVLYHWIIPPG